MTDVTVAAGNVTSGRLTLEPNVLTTVTFADKVAAVTITSNGAASVYYTVNGDTPTADGGNTFELPAGPYGVDTRGTVNAVLYPVRHVKLLSPGPAVVRVQVA